MCEYSRKKIDASKSQHENTLVGAGTRAYMSPEQLSAASIRPNTDLWSFGVIAFEAFTGEKPFTTGEHPSSSELGRIYLTRQIHEAKLPKAINSVPEPWRRLIRLCLVSDPNKRIKSADECFKVLGLDADGLPPKPPEPEPGPRPPSQTGGDRTVFMPVCRRCGVTVPQGSAVCPGCKSSDWDKPLVPDRTGGQTDQTDAQATAPCRQCGKMKPAASKFCPYCAAPDWSVPSSVPAESPQGAGSLNAWAMCLALLPVLTLVFLMALRNTLAFWLSTPLLVALKLWALENDLKLLRLSVNSESKKAFGEYSAIDLRALALFMTLAYLYQRARFTDRQFAPAIIYAAALALPAIVAIVGWWSDIF